MRRHEHSRPGSDTPPTGLQLHQWTVTDHISWTVTDHISWATRGYFEDEIPGLEAAGYTPITAPGPLYGLSWFWVFRQRRGKEFTVVGGKRYSPTSMRVGACGIHLSHAFAPTAMAAELQIKSLQYIESIPILDGFFIHEPNSLRPTADRFEVHGFRLMRLFCHRLGLRPPGRLSGEPPVPTNAEIESDYVGDRFLQAFSRLRPRSPRTA